MVSGVIGLDVDPGGRISTMAFFDPEAAGFPGDPDFGPFRSSAWRVRRIRPAEGLVTIDLSPQATRGGTMDAVKGEPVTVDATSGSPLAALEST